MAEEMYLPNQDQPDLSLNMSPIETEATYDPLAALKVQSPTLPVIPDPKPTIGIANEQVVGNYRTGPMPGTQGGPAKKNNNTEDFVRGVKNFMQGAAYAEDPLKYAKPYSFGFDAKAGSFERFYGHRLFNKLGFSPYRQNDEWYNEKGSWWDDHVRMWSEFTPLVFSAFKSVYGSEKDADEAMSKGMERGTSTRPGFGSWVNNFFLQSAYTVGIMSEVVLEDLALATAEAYTAGGASALVPGQIARNSMLFSKLATGINTTSDLIKELSAVDKAKSFWSMSKAGEIGTGALEFLNPLSHTTNWAIDASKGARGYKNMSELAKTTRTFGNFYRDVREFNLAYAESKFEGEAASRELQDDLVDEYYATHGIMPSQEEAKRIHEIARSTKAAVTLAGTPIVYYTNRIVFENIFGSWKAGAKVAKTMEHAGERYLKRTAAKEWGIGKAAYEAGAKTTRQKAFDYLTKSSFLPWSKRYMLGNLSEGLQESSQEVIASGYKDYYRRLYEDPSQVGFYKAIESIGRGVDSQFSAEGLNTFLSGYLMGTLIQGGGALYKAGKDKVVSAVTGVDKAAKLKEREQQETNDTLNAANHVINNFKIYGDHTNTMGTAVKVAFEERNAAIERGDTKTAYDMADQGNIQYFHHLVRSGNKKLVTDWANEMAQLSDEDIADATNSDLKDVPSVRKSIETLKERLDRYELRYNEAVKKFPNPFNPWLYNSKKNPEAFAKEYEDYEAHENTIADLVFSIEDYARIAERMESISRNLAGQSEVFQNLINVNQNGTPVANAAAHDVSLLIDGAARAETISMLSNQISIMKKGTPEQQKQVKPLEKQLELLKRWDGTRDFYMTQLKAEKKPMTKKERSERAKKLKVRPGAIATHDKTAEKFTIVDIKGDKVLVETASGKKKYVSINTISVIKPATVKGEFDKVYGDDVSFAIGELYDTYKEYLGHVADMKKGYTFDEQLNEAFRQIKDFLHLQVDSFNTVKAINFLSNPDYFEQYRVLQSNLLKELKTQRLYYLENALKSFNTLRHKNKMLNEIYDLGLFVIPDEIDDINNFQIPKNFYSVTTKEIINKDNPKYDEAVKIITNYAELAGKKVTTTEEEEAKKEEASKPGKAPVSKQPAEEEEEEELGPNEPVKITTPIAVMKGLGGGLVESLVEEYKKLREEEGTPITATVNEIIQDQDFIDYVQAGGTSADIIDQYNIDNDRVEEEEEPISTKEELSKDAYSVGNKHNFSGTVLSKDKYITIEDRPVEVINRSRPFENEDGDIEELVVLEDQETGERYTIDLQSANAKQYKLSDFTEVERIVTKESQISELEDIISISLENMEDTLNEIETEEELDFEEKVADILKTMKTIVNDYGIDPDSVQEFMDNNEDDIIYELYKKHKTDVLDIIENISKINQLRFEEKEEEKEEELTSENAYVKLMDEYSKINSQKSLDNWYEKALDLKSSGKIPSSIKILTLVEAKKMELATKVEWEDLTSGTSVILINDIEMIVVIKTDKSVSLVTPTAWASKSFGDSMEISIEDYKDKIKNIVNDFSDEVEEEEGPSESDINDMDEGLEDVKNDTDEQIDMDIDDARAEKAAGKSIADFKDDLINAITNCSTSK